MRSVLIVLGLLCPGCYRSHQRALDANVDAPVVCPAMDAHGLPGCTVGVDDWAFWDGTACVVSVCVCRGTDCGRVYPDLASCERTYAHCTR